MLGGLAIEHAADDRAQPPSLEPTHTPPGALGAAAAQRRPLALLALLAIAGEAGRSRDEVLLHLWPDSTPVRARNVLKQTLYALRRDLGAPDLVLASGERLQLNPAVLTSDVAELEAALDRGEIERALALYRGSFLDGFSLPNVPEFERWAQRERERLVARIDAARERLCHEPPDLQISPEASPPRAPRRRTTTPWRSRRWIAALVALTSLAAVQAARRAYGTAPAPATIDPHTMAVLPFDVANADTALRFLANGMVDLLAVRLTGDRDGGLRAVAPRIALGAWERASGTQTTPAALALAERLGAGRVLRGGVVGTPGHLALTADLLAVPGGRAMARASVSGSADSLSVLVDRLAATLLLGADAADAGAEPAVRMALAATPLAAIRDYVEGQAAYRAGHYDAAVQRFDRALARDSMFALAALGLAQSAGWAGASAPTIQRGARLAWRYQDRLPQRARLVLLASVGGADALRTGYAPDAAVTTAVEHAADANPDDPEMWYRLGDHYLHLGPAIGLAAPIERASAAFRRAIALDRTFVPPIIHLIQLAARSGDTSAVRRLATELLQHDSTSESAQFIRWRTAVALGDSAALRTLQSRFDEMPLGTLRLILTTAQGDAVGLGDADRALEAMLRHSATADERANALVHAHAYALDRGRRSDAVRATEALRDAEPVPRWHLRIRVLDALYGGGDTAAARAAIDTLRSFADAPLANDARERSAQYDDITVVTQWRLWAGDRRGLARALQRLTAAGSPRDSLRRVVANRMAAALLRAIAANTDGSRDLETVVALDDLVAANVVAPFEWPWLYPALVAARLFAINDRPQRALTAVRRRATYFPESTYLSASLELEARLAAQLGDSARARAIRRDLDALRAPSRADADGLGPATTARGRSPLVHRRVPRSRPA
jgi:tetratricopeptide (TPR) repeat protein